MATLKFFVESLRLLILSLLLLLLLGVYSFKNSGQQKEVEEIEKTTISKKELSPLAANGKVIFKSNCASCHHKNMKDNLIGHTLAGSY